MIDEWNHGIWISAILGIGIGLGMGTGSITIGSGTGSGYTIFTSSQGTLISFTFCKS